MSATGSKRPPDYCRDCWVEWVKFNNDRLPCKPFRPIVPDSGTRCKTHWRMEKARRREANHERNVQKVYGLSPGEYENLYQFQGGRCALCLRATGATRKLSVDHDHATGLVRGLLCRPCNTLLGHARDSAEFFVRCIGYLNNPPAQRKNQ